MASTETLIQISKALDMFLEKAKFKTRVRSSLVRLMREHEKKMRPKVNEFLELMIKEIRKGLPKLKGKKAKDIKRLADWNYINEEGARIMKPVLLDALVAGGDSVVRRRIVKQERFDPIGVEAVTWADEHAAELVTGVVAETKKGIKAFIKDGVNAGKSIPKIAREMRPVVGLTDRYAGAVGRFATELYTRPKYSALTDVQRNSKIERYARKLQRIRTETIARTETASALSEGTLQGYGQMGVKRVEGVSDPDACDECKDEISGKVYTLAEANGKIPVHPDCLPGDCLISPRGKIMKVIRRWYEGEFVVIKTASGKSLSATPNHPVVLNGGKWSPINALKPGDSINSLDGGRGMKPPKSIKEIVDSFLFDRNYTGTRHMLLQKRAWFHGDGTEGRGAIIADVLDEHKLPRFARLAKDKIVSVEHADFSGWVYNLETESHSYIANGIVVENCECGWVAA